MIRKYAVAWMTGLLMAVPASADTVRLVTGDDLPPYAGKQLPHYGMLTEIVQRAFEQAGSQTTLDWAPWKRGYELTKVGEYDATFPYARTAEREKDYLYSDLIYGGIRSVYARPGSAIDPARPDSFRGLSYCAPSGFIVYPQMEALLRQGAITVQRPFSLASCVKMLAIGRVDFFITDSVSGDNLLRRMQAGSSVARIAKPFDHAEFHLIVPKNRAGAQALIARFNGGLKRLKSNGEYARIVQRHLR